MVDEEAVEAVGWDERDANGWRARTTLVAKLVAVVLFAVAVTTLVRTPADDSAIASGLPVGSGIQQEVPSSIDLSGTDSGVDGMQTEAVGVGTPPASTPAPPPNDAESSPSSVGPPASPPFDPSAPQPDPKPDSVAVASPTLRFLQFGSEVGLPLACGVLTSLLASGVPTAEVAQVVTVVSQSCREYGTSGADALEQMDASLSALAVANPAIVPTVEAFAALLEGIADADVPFSVTFRQLAATVRFFQG